MECRFDSCSGHTEVNPAVHAGFFLFVLQCLQGFLALIRMNGFMVSDYDFTLTFHYTPVMNQRIIISVIVLYCSLFTQAGQAQTVSSVDIVKVDARYQKEAEFFYRENWQAFRKKAMEKNVISGFEMMQTPTDSTGHYTLILITRYQDSVYYHSREKNFEPIMKSISPNGPKMLNNIDRKQFLQYVDGFDATTISSGRKS